MRDIIDEAYETCRRTLTEHIDQLHALAQALMERESSTSRSSTPLWRAANCPAAEPAESAEPAEQAEQAVLGEEMPDRCRMPRRITNDRRERVSWRKV